MDCTEPYPLKINNSQEWYCPNTGLTFNPMLNDPSVVTICPFFNPIFSRINIEKEENTKEKKSLSLTERTLYNFLRYIKYPVAVLSLPHKYIGALGNLNSAGLITLYWSHIKKKNASYDEIIKIKMVRIKEGK
jgi:hypothetical protein